MEPKNAGHQEPSHSSGDQILSAGQEFIGLLVAADILHGAGYMPDELALAAAAAGTFAIIATWAGRNREMLRGALRASN